MTETLHISDTDKFAGTLSEHIIQQLLDGVVLSSSELKPLFEEKLGGVLRDIGKILQPIIVEAIRKKHHVEVTPALLELTSKEALGHIAEDFANAILADLRENPAVLADKKELGAKLGEIAEGFSAFTEAELRAVTEKEINLALESPQQPDFTSRINAPMQGEKKSYAEAIRKEGKKSPADIAKEESDRIHRTHMDILDEMDERIRLMTAEKPKSASWIERTWQSIVDKVQGQPSARTHSDFY